VVVQSDAVCSEAVGSLLQLPVDDPQKGQDLKAEGDNPVFQPLTLGG
jgi:hypothetical protein